MGSSGSKSKSNNNNPEGKTRQYLVFRMSPCNTNYGCSVAGGGRRDFRYLHVRGTTIPCEMLECALNAAIILKHDSKRVIVLNSGDFMSSDYRVVIESEYTKFKSFIQPRNDGKIGHRDEFKEIYENFFFKEVQEFLKQFQLFEKFMAEQAVDDSCFDKNFRKFLDDPAADEKRSSWEEREARRFLQKQDESDALYKVLSNVLNVKDASGEEQESSTVSDGKEEVSDTPIGARVLRTKENTPADPMDHILEEQKIGKVKVDGSRALTNAGKGRQQIVCNLKKKDTRPNCYCQNVAIYSEKKEDGHNVPLCKGCMNPDVDGEYLH